MAPSTPALLTQWSWEPSVLIGITLLAALYFYAVGPLRRRYQWGPPASTRQVTYFILSIITLVIALLSPIDYIGDRYLFSVHMTQHLLLATLWPPLVLLSIPSWLARRLLRPPLLSSAWSFLVYPAVATILFSVDIYAWHLPPLYDATLTNEWVHIGEHLSFMLTGLIVFWPVLSPIVEQRLSYPFQMLYVLVNGMIMMVLGIVFTFAPDAFYPPYISAPRLWGLSAAADQQIGGLIMWYPGNLPYAVIFIAAFYLWFESGETSPVESQRISSQSSTIGPQGS